MNPTVLAEMIDRVIDDRYRLASLLGSSEISAVFAAYDALLQRWVAIKVFDEKLHVDEEFVDRLFEGVSEAALINHPNIVQIHDWGVEGGPFIVTELCEGGSLAALLAQGDRLTPSQGLVVALECARGLHQAHSAGLVHRNLRPTNVLFDAEQRVKIADFGLAKVLAEAPVPLVETALENIRYSSPEQARGRVVGPPTDLYSLALVMNEAVAGSKPSVQDTVVGSLMARAESVAALSPELDSLIGPFERCGRVDAAERPEAEELTIALLAAAESMPRPSAFPVAEVQLPDLTDETRPLDDAFAALDDSAGLKLDGDGEITAEHDLPVLSVVDGDLPDHPEDAIAEMDPMSDASASDLSTSAEADELVEDGLPQIGLASDTAHELADDFYAEDIQVTVPGLEGLDTPATATVDGAPPLDDEDLAAIEEIDRAHADLNLLTELDIPVSEADPDTDFDVSALGALDDFDDFAADDFAAGGLDEPDASDAPDALTGEDNALDNVVSLPQAKAPVALENLSEAAPVFADEVEDDGDALDIPERRATARAPRVAYEELEDDADQELPWWPLALLGVVVAGAIAASVYFLGFSGAVDTARVPDVVGMSFEDLESELAEFDWKVERLETRGLGAAGEIVRQSPEVGTELDDDGTLAVTVSLGDPLVDIPSDIVGLSLDQAASRLIAQGLELGTISEENNEDLGDGVVIALDEPTTQKALGEGVALRVSLGPVDREIPDGLVGQTIGDATILLTGLRILQVEDQTYSEDIEAGIVMGSVPPAGQTVPADSAITLIVSAGPEPVVMPDIVGLPLSAAVDAIEELGLIFIDSTGTPGEDAIGSLPPIGATVDVGAEVTIILADGEDEDGEDDG